ncbi:hypothetical protein [Arachidicoccus sp.]|uniref:hypothetical protein n=1 Tax=Arachidicoccus sp. TaxID=1872624 RepID=UPI003D204C9D
MKKTLLLFLIFCNTIFVFGQNKLTLSRLNSTIQTFFNNYVSAAELINTNSEIEYTLACGIKDGNDWDWRPGDYYAYYSVFIDGTQLHADDLFHYDSYEVKVAGCSLIFKAKGLWGCSHNKTILDSHLVLKRIPIKGIRDVRAINRGSPFSHGCGGTHYFPTLEIDYIDTDNQIKTIDIPLNEEANADQASTLVTLLNLIVENYCDVY